MPETFYGKWSLDVIGNVNEFQQRLRIVGSVASDGVVSGALGTHVAAIDGDGWQVFLERSGDGGATWQSNLVQNLMSVNATDGLIVTLYGDDSNVPPQSSDVTVKFVYLDPQVNPQPGPQHHFTLPPDHFWPPLPPRPCSACCRCPCTCRRAKPPQRKKGGCCG